MPKNKKLALDLGIQTYQILTNDDEVCIPSLSSILSCTYCDRFSFPFKWKFFRKYRFQKHSV